MDYQSYNQNQELNSVMSGSKRRSRLKLGIANLPNSDFFVEKNGSLGIIEIFQTLHKLKLVMARFWGICLLKIIVKMLSLTGIL